jgi:cytochrome c peroxidase
VLVNFAKAIEAYEYKLISRDSDFDRWVKAGPRSLVIPPEARRGARLFVSKAGCIDCHSGPLLGDGAYRNIGVPQVGAAVPTVADCPAGAACDCAAGKGCLPWGAYDGLKRLAAHKFRRDDKQWSDDPEDPTRKSLYLSNPPDALKGTWRTPSLRDVALTAPYMHDGIYRSLDEVIWHYDSGGGPLANESVAATRAVQLKPLRLTEGERSDLVAFLHTLNGRLPADLLKAPP